MMQSRQLSLTQNDLSHQQTVADNHFITTAETWKSLEAELDTVKTIYSSSKFIYLNRFFCEGSEILTLMKIFARADKKFNRRFATIYFATVRYNIRWV